MIVDIFDPDPRVETSRFETTLNNVVKGEQKTASFINVIFVSREDLRNMKQQYFDIDVYTDVVSFNLNEPGAPIEGEIYLSLEDIETNAIEYKTDSQTELYRVLIHGCLHLCGYEDDTPERKVIMSGLEDKYLAILESEGAH